MKYIHHADILSDVVDRTSHSATGGVGAYDVQWSSSSNGLSSNVVAQKKSIQSTTSDGMSFHRTPARQDTLELVGHSTSDGMSFPSVLSLDVVGTVRSKHSFIERRGNGPSKAIFR